MMHGILSCSFFMWNAGVEVGVGEVPVAAALEPDSGGGGEGATKAAESATVRPVVWRTVHLHLGLRVDPYSPKKCAKSSNRGR
jgi:hypothetical protein